MGIITMLRDTSINIKTNNTRIVVIPQTKFWNFPFPILFREFSYNTRVMEAIMHT